MANGADYDALRTASHRDLSWNPFSSTFYLSDLPTTVSRKYAYADDLAIMHANGDWQAVEGLVSKDMATVGKYLQNGKLKLSTTKMLSAAFYQYNREVKRELIVNNNVEMLPFYPSPNTSV